MTVTEKLNKYYPIKKVNKSEKTNKKFGEKFKNVLKLTKAEKDSFDRSRNLINKFRGAKWIKVK